MTRPAVAVNRAGQLEVVVRAADGLPHKLTIPQTGAPSGWGTLGSPGGMRPLLTDPAIVVSSERRLEAFGTDRGGKIIHLWQELDANGNAVWRPIWDDFATPEAGVRSTPAVAAQRDGRIMLVLRLDDGQINWKQQEVPGLGVFTAWIPMGFLRSGAFSTVKAVGQPVIGMNADGRLEAFTRGSDGALWHMWEIELSNTLNLSDWNSLGPPIKRLFLSNTDLVSDVAIAANNFGGGLDVFGAGDDGSMWHRWQQPAWHAWARLGRPSASVSVVHRSSAAANADGRAELFLRGSDNRIWHRWQDQTFNWPSGWTQLGSLVADGDPVAIPDGAGALNVFVTNGFELFRNHQSPVGNGWAGWQSLGVPA